MKEVVVCMVVNKIVGHFGHLAFSPTSWHHMMPHPFSDIKWCRYYSQLIHWWHSTWLSYLFRDITWGHIPFSDIKWCQYYHQPIYWWHATWLSHLYTSWHRRMPHLFSDFKWCQYYINLYIGDAPLAFSPTLHDIAGCPIHLVTSNDVIKLNTDITLHTDNTQLLWRVLRGKIPLSTFFIHKCNYMYIRPHKTVPPPNMQSAIDDKECSDTKREDIPVLALDPASCTSLNRIDLLSWDINPISEVSRF